MKVFKGLIGAAASLSLLASISLGVLGDDDSCLATKGQGEQCRPMYEEDVPKYHQSTACDYAAQNRFRQNLGRWYTHRMLQKTGTTLLPNMKTIRCPTTVNNLIREDMMTGFDVMAIFENTAQVPIVVAWVHPETGILYSAENSHITPPQNDPQAILQPGEWKSFHTYEGHVFHLHEVLEDDELGPVLLQQRMGLIPIKNRYGPPITCDPNEPDPEPILEETGDRDPEYARTISSDFRPCNTLDIGFRNQVGCPLHGYYTALQKANVTTGEPSCNEEFKFHLGLNPRPEDYLWDWESQTKYEGTFVGHSFVFRLAKDPSVLVDQYTVQPTFIVDCPNLGKQKINIETKAKAEIEIAMPSVTFKSFYNITTNKAGTFSNRTRKTTTKQARKVYSYLENNQFNTTAALLMAVHSPMMTF